MTEFKFNPVPPAFLYDEDGGKYKNPNPFPVLKTAEDLLTDIEQKLDIKPGELSNDDPADPDYRPATDRTEKWKRFKETGEV